MLVYVFIKPTYPASDVTTFAESTVYILYIFANNFGTLIRKAFDIHFVTNESDNKLILFEQRFDVTFTSFSSSFKVRYYQCVHMASS